MGGWGALIPGLQSKSVIETSPLIVCVNSSSQKLLVSQASRSNLSPAPAISRPRFLFMLTAFSAFAAKRAVTVGIQFVYTFDQKNTKTSILQKVS